MICSGNAKRHKRKVTVAVESLDDRIVLSAASALGTQAAAAVEIAPATPHSAGLVRRFDAGLDHLNGLANQGLDNFNGQVNNQIGGVDAATQALIGQTGMGINNVPIVNVGTIMALNRVNIAVAEPLDRFISRFEIGLNRFTRDINNRLVLLGRRFDSSDPALESAVSTGQGELPGRGSGGQRPMAQRAGGGARRPAAWDRCSPQCDRQQHSSIAVVACRSHQQARGRDRTDRVRDDDREPTRHERWGWRQPLRFRPSRNGDRLRKRHRHRRDRHRGHAVLLRRATGESSTHTP